MKTALHTYDNVRFIVRVVQLFAVLLQSIFHDLLYLQQHYAGILLHLSLLNVLCTFMRFY